MRASAPRAPRSEASSSRRENDSRRPRPPAERHSCLGASFRRRSCRRSAPSLHQSSGRSRTAIGARTGRSRAAGQAARGACEPAVPSEARAEAKGARRSPIAILQASPRRSGARRVRGDRRHRGSDLRYHDAAHGEDARRLWRRSFRAIDAPRSGPQGAAHETGDGRAGFVARSPGSRSSRRQARGRRGRRGARGRLAESAARPGRSDDERRGRVSDQANAARYDALFPGVAAQRADADVETFRLAGDRHLRISDRGRRHSQHRYCKAADIQIAGVRPSQIVGYAQLQDEVGGIGTYRHTRSVHVDVREQKISQYGNRGRGHFRLAKNQFGTN
ncbi:MAG: hypothetical protein HZY79_09510 [Rhodoblastus sp.]|nr:MAG: hypothetical protein HZY79_09510 [Rhodoblastus sp.]